MYHIRFAFITQKNANECIMQSRRQWCLPPLAMISSYPGGRSHKAIKSQVEKLLLGTFKVPGHSQWPIKEQQTLKEESHKGYSLYYPFQKMLWIAKETDFSLIRSLSGFLPFAIKRILNDITSSPFYIFILMVWKLHDSSICKESFFKNAFIIFLEICFT